MAEKMLNVPMDEELKKDFESFCAEYNTDTAFMVNLFAEMIVEKKELPFYLRSYAYEKNTPIRRHTAQEYMENINKMRDHAAALGLDKMTLDEINEEIRKARCGEGA